MKCGARVALGVAGGYFLGRTKKMKLALMLGGIAAGRRLGGPGEILGQGAKLLRQSPELAALTDQVRGRLLEAGKGAALAVATRQVESLTDRVGTRVESLGSTAAGAARSTAGAARSTAAGAARSTAGAARSTAAGATRGTAKSSTSEAPGRRAGGSAPASRAKRTGTRNAAEKRRRPAGARGGGGDG